MASVAKATKKPTGPAYYDLIKEAVLTRKDRAGSSRQAIDKFVAEKKGVGYSKSRLNIALKKSVEAGKLVVVKGCFKLSANEKKSPSLNSTKSKKRVNKKEPTQATKAATVGKKSKVGKKQASVKKSTAAGKLKKTMTKKVTAKKPSATKKKVVKKSTAKKA